MSLSNLGLCCEWIEPITKKSGKVEFKNTLDQKSLQLGRWRDGKYTEAHVRGVYLHNARSLRDNLEKIGAAGIRLFRVSSSMFSLSDQVPRSWWDNDHVKRVLKQAGDVARKWGIRLTTHPGQFCVISSDSDSVVAKSIVELEHHAWIFDAMEVPQSSYSAINIHGGKSDRDSRLIEVINSLPVNIKTRLTLENDESSYDTMQLVNVAKSTGISVVFDSHHHTFNTGDVSLDYAMRAAMDTWSSGIRPLQHLSNTSPDLINGSFTDRRKHSDFVHYIPDPQMSLLRSNDVDIECEFKMKNLAIFKMVKDFKLA
jgi:UV DNA damage endonuclease